MNKKKRNGIMIFIIVLFSILFLWISGIIPKQIAKISATNYLKNNFPKMKLEFVDIEWSPNFAGYSIRFKNEKNEIYAFIMNNKYFPITLGQGMFKLEEEYREQYKMPNITINKENIEGTEANVEIKKLIVVNIKEKTLQTIDFENTLYIVSVKNEDMNKFKRGQEIEVYFDGIIEAFYPGIIRADKIKISKEKTNIEIPIEVLRHYSYSQNNISVQIKELSNKNIVFEIIDSNEIPLEYGNDYKYTIFKKNIENEEYNDSLGIDYNAITPAVTTDSYSTTSSYSPDPNRFKKVWEEVEIIGNEEYKNCEWKTNLKDNMILEGRSDWTNVYGELNEGEYKFRVLRKSSEKDSFFREILIHFIIDEKDNLIYNKPEFGW